MDAGPWVEVLGELATAAVRLWLAQAPEGATCPTSRQGRKSSIIRIQARERCLPLSFYKQLRIVYIEASKRLDSVLAVHIQMELTSPISRTQRTTPNADLCSHTHDTSPDRYFKTPIDSRQLSPVEMESRAQDTYIGALRGRRRRRTLYK